MQGNKTIRRAFTLIKKGFTLIELLIVMAIILTMAAIAVPHVNQQIMLGHETAAIEQIKTIQAAETQYFAQFGKYACNLVALGPPVSGASGPEAAGLIPESLASGKKSGYAFMLQCTEASYAILAAPDAFGSSGRRNFYSDLTIVIRESWTKEPANSSSPAIN